MAGMTEHERALIEGAVSPVTQEEWEFAQAHANDVLPTITPAGTKNPYGVDTGKMARDFEKYGEPSKGSQD